MRILGIAALCAALGGCVSTGETVAFKPSNPNQQAMMRDGQPALVSRQKSSLVLVRPAARQLQANGRPVFVVGINNFGKQPVDFRVDRVEAIQHVGGNDFSMPIVTFEMLQQEEKNRQVAMAILGGVAAVQIPTALRALATDRTRRQAVARERSTARRPLPSPRTTRPFKTKQCSPPPSKADSATWRRSSKPSSRTTR